MEILNLLAFSLSIIFFLYFGFVGYAGLSILRTQRNVLQNIFIAPAVGIAINLLPIFWLNRLGLPVERFALNLAIIMLLVSCIILWKTKPLFPIKKYTPFLLGLLLCLFIVGFPLLKFGFNWVSYANSDMSFYCLSADLFKHHGYSELPNISNLLEGRDYSIHEWAYHYIIMHRSGSELILAFFSVILRLNPHQIYMPLIVGLNLCLISASAGIVYQSRKYKKEAILLCLLLSVSALNALGVFYNLIAQVGGLALLIATSTIVLQAYEIHQKNLLIRLPILISILTSALLIYYPEVAPFGVLAFVLYVPTVSIINKKLPNNNFYKIIGLSLVFIIIMLNYYLLNVYAFTFSSVHSQVHATTNSLFPYYFLPSGFANLWGFQPISRYSGEPWLTFSVLSGFTLYLAVIAFTFIQIKKKIPIAYLSLIMILLSIVLFIQKSGFGLLKLSMYIQPFIIGVLVIGILDTLKKNKLRYALIFAIAILGVPALYSYAKFSFGKMGPFVELSSASESHMLDEMNNISKKLPDNAGVAIDTWHRFSANMARSFLNGKKTTFYGVQYIEPNDLSGLNCLLKYLPNIMQASEEIIKASNDQYINLQFVSNDNNVKINNSFVTPRNLITNNSYYLTTSPLRQIFNRRKFPQDVGYNFRLSPLKTASNYLIFVNSNLGGLYRSNDTSFYNLEKDMFIENHSMAAIGRFLLFQVVNPSNPIRLELNLTATLNADSDNSLPPAVVIGDKSVRLPVLGRGSARVFSEPLKPKIINNTPYIMIDMGNDGKLFSQKRKGLMRLYGNNIKLDRRKIIGFARDISLVSDDEYVNLKPPMSIGHFPTDLANPNLEYSGIYEDGWMSESAYVKLAQPDYKAILVLQGLVPTIVEPVSSSLTVMIDGKKVAEKIINPGIFNIEIPVSVAKNRSRKIELYFSKHQLLPAPDNRPVSAQITFIGFKS